MQYCILFALLKHVYFCPVNFGEKCCTLLLKHDTVLGSHIWSLENAKLFMNLDLSHA